MLTARRVEVESIPAWRCQVRRRTGKVPGLTRAVAESALSALASGKEKGDKNGMKASPNMPAFGRPK